MFALSCRFEFDNVVVVAVVVVVHEAPPKIPDFLHLSQWLSPDGVGEVGNGGGGSDVLASNFIPGFKFLHVFEKKFSLHVPKAGISPD